MSASITEEPFVKQAFKEVDLMEQDKIASNEKVRQLLANQQSVYGTYDVGNIPIRFKLFLSKKLRHKLMKMQADLSDNQTEDGLAQSEEVMYYVLSQICVDEPFTDEKTWKYIDDTSETVGVQKIFLDIMAVIASSAEDVKNFRGK